MSNIINNTSSFQLDPLDIMLERLDASESRIVQLRQSLIQFHQSLSDLETEQAEIRQQCRNAIRARTSDGKARMNVSQAMDKNPNHAREVRIPPGLVAVQGREEASEANRELKRELAEQDGDDRQRKRLRPDHKLLNPSASIHFVENESRSYTSLSLPVSNPQHNTIAAQPWLQGVGVRVLAHKHENRPPILQQMPLQHPPQRPPQPPTDPFPFIENFDISSYPPGFKCEGPGGLAFFNPSPKVKRALNLNLVHTLIHNSDYGMFCVKFSRNGKWLATGFADCNAKIYNVKTGVKTCVLDHSPCSDHDGPIIDLSFSPDDTYLATVLDDTMYKIVVWNIARRQIVNIFEDRTICFLQFSSNGQFIVFRSTDSICIWDVHNGTSRVLPFDEHYASPRIPYNRVSALALSPDDKYIAVGHSSGVVGILDITTGMVVQRLRGHTDAINCVAFLPDGQGLISGSEDQTLKRWDVSELGIGLGGQTVTSSTRSRCLMNFNCNYSIWDIAISHDGTWIVSSSRKEGEAVLFWDARTGVLQCMLSGHPDGVSSIDLSPTANLLATVDKFKHVRIWSY